MLQGLRRAAILSLPLAALLLLPAPAAWCADPAPWDTRVQIDFEDEELVEVAKYFAELTGRNFLIAEKLRAKITIFSPAPVSVEEAYAAFVSALNAAGYAAVAEGEVLRIVPRGEASKEPIGTYPDGTPPPTANMVTHIFRVEHAAVDDLSKFAQKRIGSGGSVTTFAPTRSLILTDSAHNLRRVEDLLRELDVEAPTERIEVIPLAYADAASMVEQIEAIFVEAQEEQPTPRKSRRTRRSRRARRKARKAKAAAKATADTVGQAVSLSEVLPDERTNSVILRGTDVAIAEVREYVEMMDHDADPASQGNIHVVYLENALAEELAQVLNNLVQDQSRGRRVQPGRGRRGRRAAQAPAEPQGQFTGQVQITADAPTNSLVVIASPDDFQRLERVVQLLDIRRRQVFVEAVIMEVTRQSERDAGASAHSGYGKEQLGESELGLGGVASVGGSTLLSALSPDSGLAYDVSGAALGIFGSPIPIPFPGSESGTLEIPAFGVVLHALQQDTHTEVLSAPNLLTLDNEEAEIIVGQTIPFSAGFTTTTQGMPIANFSREDVALTLRVTPQISEGDTVQLQVFQEITEVVPESQGSDLLSSGGVSTTKRSVETVITAEDDQTIVLGGLIQRSETTSEDKVPLLGDVPGLGAAFRTEKDTDKHTNLLLFLTPHVIDGPEDLREVTRIKMLQRDEFLRRFYGKSLQEQQQELYELLMYSMNLPGLPPVYADDAATSGEEPAADPPGEDGSDP